MNAVGVVLVQEGYLFAVVFGMVEQPHLERALQLKVLNYHVLELFELQHQEIW